MFSTKKLIQPTVLGTTSKINSIVINSIINKIYT